MTAFDRAWDIFKMPWQPEQIEHQGLTGDQHGPLPAPVDAGLYRPHYAAKDPDWFHQHTYNNPRNKGNRKKNQWDMDNDQEWVLNPFPTHNSPSGEWIQVDRLMKPLLESLWGRGISTKFSDTGGDMRAHPNAEHFEEIRDKSIYGNNKHYYVENPDEPRLSDDEGYLWFGDAGVPEEGQTFPTQTEYVQSYDQPHIDSRSDATRGQTLRWSAADDVAQLRQIYEAFDVPFPEEHIEEGGIKWR